MPIPPEIALHFPVITRISELTGGFTNTCYQIQTPDGTFAFRIGQSNPEKYGFNRAQELECYQLAENHSLAPRLHSYDLSKGILIMDFIHGTLIDDTLIRQETMIPKVANFLLQLHSIKGPINQEPFTISLIKKQMQLLDPLPIGWEEIIQSTLEKMPRTNHLVLCHNDLAFNLLIKNEQLLAIDWECAGWNDPLFDLSPLCIWHNFSHQEKRALLQAYFGNTHHENDLDQAIRITLIMNALWSLLKAEQGDQSYYAQAFDLFAKATR